MKIEFDDKSYVSIDRGKEPDKIVIIIAAADNTGKITIINSVELNQEQFNQLINFNK